MGCGRERLDLEGFQVWSVAKWGREGKAGQLDFGLFPGLLDKFQEAG